MMFDFAKFLTENLITGFNNGSFTKEQVGLYAFNYFTRQQITQDDFDTILEILEPSSIIEDTTEGD